MSLSSLLVAAGAWQLAVLHNDLALVFVLRQELNIQTRLPVFQVTSDRFVLCLLAHDQSVNSQPSYSWTLYFSNDEYRVESDALIVRLTLISKPLGFGGVRAPTSLLFVSCSNHLTPPRSDVDVWRSTT